MEESFAEDVAEYRLLGEDGSAVHDDDINEENDLLCDGEGGAGEGVDEDEGCMDDAVATGSATEVSTGNNLSATEVSTGNSVSAASAEPIRNDGGDGFDEDGWATASTDDLGNFGSWNSAQPAGASGFAEFAEFPPLESTEPSAEPLRRTAALSTEEVAMIKSAMGALQITPPPWVRQMQHVQQVPCR